MYDVLAHHYSLSLPYIVIINLYIQASRFNVGDIANSVTWIPNWNAVLWQTKMDSLILSILLEEHANLGLTEEYILSLKGVLTPLFSS